MNPFTYRSTVQLTVIGLAVEAIVGLGVLLAIVTVIAGAR